MEIGIGMGHAPDEKRDITQHRRFQQKGHKRDGRKDQDRRKDPASFISGPFPFPLF